MFRVRFIDPETNTVRLDAIPINGSVNYRLNQTTDWSATFPRNLANLDDISEGFFVELYYKNRLLLEGILQSFNQKWAGNTVDISMQGRGITDKLYDYKAYSYGYYEQKERVLILASLLERAGWRVGRIDTWSNPTDLMTIDLRNDKRLLSQITTLIAGLPGVFFRYGGRQGGYHVLDIGTFNEDSGVALIRASDLGTLDDVFERTGLVEDASLSTTLSEIVNSVEVWGGEVLDDLGVTRTIFLKDALAADPSLASDPEFPIVTELTNHIYSIRNVAVPLTKGSQSVERYNQYAPEKTDTNATVAAIQSAALALYERGVAFLLDHQDNVETLSVKAIGDDLFCEVGDQVYLSLTARQPIIDPFSDQIIDVAENNIHDSYRISGLSVNFDGNQISWSFDVTNSLVVKNEDLFVSVFDESRSVEQTAGSAAIAGYNHPELASYSLSVNGGYPNTTMSDGIPGLQVSIPVPITGLPVWTPTKVYMAHVPTISGTTSPIVIEIVQDFAYPSQPMILKIAVKNTGWSDAISCNIDYRVVWSQ